MCMLLAHNSPTAKNTEFGWVLAGNTGSQADTQLITTHLTSILMGDDLLCQLCEIEEKAVANYSHGGRTMYD